VVGCIVPWNFPINLSFAPLVGIFAAGNRAMVKMSENSRHLCQYLMQTIPAYFSRDKLAFFDETGGVGVAFSQLKFDHLLFTGSAATGRAVMAAAAQNLCPVTLELGGKTPAILCDDFPLRKAAERLMFVKCLNAGQICLTVDHLFLPAGKTAEFVALAKEIVLQRYPSLDSPDLSAIIDARTEDEFALDHLPGALNWPSLNNAQRIVIGTLYKQVGPFDAKKKGAAWVAANISNHIENHVLDLPKDWQPLVYCWRGGKRSGSLALILGQIGFKVAIIEGGYKAFRSVLVADIPELAERLAGDY
jgi:rhodanese-related sulfurtransferase